MPPWVGEANTAGQAGALYRRGQDGRTLEWCSFRIQQTQVVALTHQLF